MTGILIKLDDRPDIIFDNGTFYGGLHCGAAVQRRGVPAGTSVHGAAEPGKISKRRVCLCPVHGRTDPADVFPGGALQL